VIDEDAEIEAASHQGGTGVSGSDPQQSHAVADIGATLEDEPTVPKRRWRLFRKGGE